MPADYKPVRIAMLKVNSKDTRATSSERSSVFIVTFIHISQLLYCFCIVDLEHAIVCLAGVFLL